MSGATGLPQLSFDMVAILSAEQHACDQSPNSSFIPHTPGTTVFVGLRGRF